MQKNITLKLLPSEATNDRSVRKAIAAAEATSTASITGYNIIKHSIDARSRQVWISLTVNAYIDEPFHERERISFHFRDVSKSPLSVVIVGAGPAGLFAALRLLELGIRPILLERGKDVRARRRDLARLNKEGEVNPESNYCFGEGGAGTYSDGKLYTRSSKRGDINRILNLFVYFGAEDKILYEAHPHIGTNKLPQIITAMREKITDCGGEFLFNKKVVDFTLTNNTITAVHTADGDKYTSPYVILATGHSARDIFELLHKKNIRIEAKPFALGVRIEHPQSLIDSVQYHQPQREDALPPASYSLVQQVEGKGVFSFCMCPGGIIAPAATSPGELVVNGWSPSKRNNPFANSGMVVSIEEKDLKKFEKEGPLAALEFQRSVEQKAFEAGGGKFVAPAQRMVDFTSNRVSDSLPDCSYLPGLQSAPLNTVLPGIVHRSLQLAFQEFGKKMKGYFTNEAIVVATESRTSSPVRIPRDPVTLEHVQVKNLYPCAEGAGYAGGIVSAAMDGERVVEEIKKKAAQFSLS
ncbi:MAG: FAD-binding protein [Chitinophagaceae bacterium]|nr:MAG: FAD-binding protein [Chitinophagaceae bacterium]